MEAEISNLFSFEGTKVYQQSRQLVKHVYLLMESFPAKEQYALCSQMRRSVTSVSSNIAEGLSRFSIKEQMHFIEIAFGSLMEIYCQLQLSADLDYISLNKVEELKELITEIAKQLSGLHRYKLTQINNNSGKS